jgi:hypothetical protein
MAPSQPHQPDDSVAADSRYRLSPADQQALDALLVSNWAPADPRQARIADALSPLAAGPTPDPALVDATLARILRATAQPAASQPQNEIEPRLTVSDAEALDAYFNSQHNLRSVPASLRDRAQRIDSFSNLITATPTPAAGRDLLIERTLARIDASRARSGHVASLAEAPARRGNWRWADLVSVAATLLVGVSVLWPLMGAWSKRASRVNCAGNMNTVAQAMGLYTGDQRGSLPMASASLAGLPWWETGKNVEHSNSANLFTLRRANYATLEQLRCGGNRKCSGEDLPNDARDWKSINDVSYSYFVMFGDRRPQWSDPSSTVVLADASPVVRRAIVGNVIYANENSWNHGGEGQWALRIDGSAIWLRTPYHTSSNGQPDNLWLPANLEEALAASEKQWRETGSSDPIRVRSRRDAADARANVTLQGRESPRGADDTFLGP